MQRARHDEGIVSMRRVFYLFGSLNDLDVEWLRTSGKLVPVQADQIIVWEGVPLDNLFILIEGKMEVASKLAGSIATLHPGEVIGEMSFVDSRLPSATVKAVATSRVLAISRHDLKAKLASDEGFASRFYYAIARFLASRLYSSVGRLGYGPAGKADDVEEIPEELMESVDMAAARFDMFLRQTDASKGFI
jgi:CRP/FNR family transcriptional regulator, cyclic AMP receptor protein